MSEYHAIHIKIQNNPTEFINMLCNYVKDKIDQYKIPSHLFYHNPNPWVTISLQGYDEADKGICEDLSRKFGTTCIIINAFHSTNSIKFTQFDNGLVTRHLSNGFGEEQYIWDTVEGEMQYWEENVFFDKKELEEILSDETELSNKERITEIWQKKTITAGEFFPMFDIDKLANELKLSGFSWDNSYNDNEYWTINKSVNYDDNKHKANRISIPGLNSKLDKNNHPNVQQKKYKKSFRVVGFLLLIVYALTHNELLLFIGILSILLSFFLKNKS
jgi:hypothetical protein